MDSKTYAITFYESGTDYSKIIVMTEEQAKAINWLIEEFNLGLEINDCASLENFYNLTDGGMEYEV